VTRRGNSYKSSPPAWQLIWRFQDVRRKILITIGLVILYRFLLNIPLPGISITPDALRQNITPGTGLHTLLEFLSMLSGSSLLTVSILSLGLLPYNLSSLLIYPWISIIPALRRKQKDDRRAARVTFERWNYFLAIPVALLEAYLFLFVLSPNCEGRLFLLEGSAGKMDILLTVTTAAALVAGSFVAVWIAGLISEYGIPQQGNIILIASGIIAQLPGELIGLLGLRSQGGTILEYQGLVERIPIIAGRIFHTPGRLETLAAYIFLFIMCIITVIYLLGGRRKITFLRPDRASLQPYLKRSSTRTTLPHLPILFTTGSDGLIGSQLLVALTTFYAPLATCVAIPWVGATAMGIVSVFGDQSIFFGPLAFLSVMYFTYYYANANFQEQDHAESLRREGSIIPNLRPGAETRDYLNRVNRRIAFVSAFLLGSLSIAPWVFNMIFDVNLSLLDGEKLLIVVGVIRDASFYVGAELKMRGYDNVPVSA